MRFDNQFKNQLFSDIREGQHEESRRSLQNQTPIFHETSQQTERCTMKIDRDATTRDLGRERQGRICSRDIDVRYMISWKSLKEKLLSGYSCNQNQCPMIKERMTIHNHSKHCGRRCDKKTSFASSRLKNGVSIRAGRDIDQYADEKCSDCQNHPTSSSYNKRSFNRIDKHQDDFTKSFKKYTNNGNHVTIEKKCADDCTSTSDSWRNRYQSSNGKNQFDEYVDTPSVKQGDEKGRYNQTDYSQSRGMGSKMHITENNADDGKCCADTSTCDDKKAKNANRNNRYYFDTSKLRESSSSNVYIRSGKYVDGYTTSENVIPENKKRNDYANGCYSGRYVDSCTGPSDGCTEYIDSCNGYTDCRNKCTDSYDTNGYVEGCPNYAYYRKNRSCTNGGYDSMIFPDCVDRYTTTCSNSYIGNIEAPKFPISQSVKTPDEENGASTSKNDKAKLSADTTNNEPKVVDNSNTIHKKTNDLIPSNKVLTVDNAAGDDSDISSAISLVSEKRNSKNKNPKTSKQAANKNSFNSTASDSQKAISPNTVDRSSKVSINSNKQKHRRYSNSNPIYKQVNEWIREVPMYPGQDKDKNTTVINDLVKNLYKLSEEAGSPDYDEKLKNEIDLCLDKIPLWYSGAKTEEIGFKRSLADRLTQRIKKVNRKNVGTNYPKPRRKNAVTAVHTSLTSCHPSFITQITNDPRDIEIKICVIDWLKSIYSKTQHSGMLKNKIFILADFVTFRINPLLNKASASNDKLILKTAILNLMNDLPIIIECPINNDLRIQDLAEDLANKLLCIQVKYNKHCKYSNNLTVSCGNTSSIQTIREMLIRDKIRKCVKESKVHFSNMMMIDEAAAIIINRYKTADSKGRHLARKDIINLLVTSTNLSETQAWNLTKMIIKNVQKVFHEKEILCASSQTCSQLRQSYTTSVFTSIEPNQETYFLTSTPKKKGPKKDVPKLNPQEMQYMKDVANLIRTWVTTLPYDFDSSDQKGFKDAMINDLASDIVVEVKLGQLVPSTKNIRENQKYVVCRWIFKLNAFEINKVDDKIETFLDELQDIPVPLMTRPQHGNRQAMENIKYNERSNWHDNFVPKGTDVLEDEISIWMHEQPSTIFKNDDQQLRQEKIHELAVDLKSKLGNERSQKEVFKDISKWLNQVLKTENKREIKELTENLKGRVINLPQDKTLADIVEKRSKLREEKKQLQLQKQNAPNTYISNSKQDGIVDAENTMAIFISKFIDHHYDIDDPLARRAFNRLLATHLQSLNPSTIKDVGENNDKFPPPQLLRELEYIKDISDWLKNIPIDASYNTLGNRERVDFVNSLALTIREVEEDRESNPDAMDYDNYLCHMILEHIILLPLPKEYHENVSFMVFQLYDRIIMHRQTVSNTVKANESINTSGLNSDNIGDFIEEFIRLNGDDIAHDEVKMEAWAIRLIREIRKIVPNITKPLPKAQMYEKIANVPVPSDETAKYFDLELGYVEEVTNWIKNLPLLPMNQRQKENITDDICELAEKMVETHKNKLLDPRNEKIVTDFKEYVKKWILKLPVGNKQDIVLPVIIQQLINRMDKIKQNEVSRSIPSESNTNKTKDSKKSGSSIFDLFNKKKSLNASSLTDAIEKWSLALPIRVENDNTTLDIKNRISRKIFQEVEELNFNPTTNKDDILFKDRLEDEINIIFENVPQNNQLQKEKEKLKEDIVNKVMKIRNDIKENTAGKIYKSQLEKTIDSSIPNPIQCNEVYDPGFEMYKDRLATVFILENFDHSSDAVKTKYETLLKKEIDKYFIHARKRNATPLSEDQLYNELYSILFRVPIPSEVSVLDEIEKLKTRCEIDAWFEELPMREAYNLNELLDWDKILSSLAIRIHDIEKTERKLDEDHIVKEIMKSLVKFPLHTTNESELKKFAMDLNQKLKSTAEHRKYVAENSKTKGIKNKSKSKTKELDKMSKQDNRVASSSSSKIMTTVNGTQNRSGQRITRNNPADEIYEIVHAWCQELLINDTNQEQPQMLKDNLTTKIIIKISELNSIPDIFNNHSLYNELLGDELEKIVATIPIICDYCNNNAAGLHQLLKKIISVKPHITEEKNMREYQQNMIKTVDKVLDRGEKVSPQAEAHLDAIRNDIIDDFVQYKYSNDNAETKQGNKDNLQDEILIFSTENANNTKIGKKRPQINTLMKTNQLISELSKLTPKSNNILNDMVEEIRMKKEVANFFNELGVSDKDVAKVNYIKQNLAKKLHDIEINGYNTENENKMKLDILKCLTKLGKEKSSTKIDAFVTKLKNNEKDRQMPFKSDKIINEIDCIVECPSRKPYLRNINCLSNISANVEKKKTIEQNGPKNWNVQHFAEPENILNEAPALDEDESTLQDEQKKIIREYKKKSCRKRRPYCMVPIPIRLFNDRRIMNPFCYGIPLPFY